MACAPDKQKYFDSDIVSCLANLAYLKGAERNKLRDNINSSVSAFNELEEAKRLVSFIKPEKSHFMNVIKPDDLDKSVLVRPKQSNPRIVAQNGAFIIFGLNGNLVRPDASTSFEVLELAVSRDCKQQILRQLDRLGFNDGSMFPELESAAKYVKGQFREH